MFQSAELTVREYLEMLRRRRWFIAAVAIVVTILGTVPSALQESVYSSSAEIQLRSEQSLSAFDSTDPENELTRSRDLETDVAILMSREMRAAVIDRLGDDAPPFDDVSASVTGFSEIVQVTVTASSAAAAADTANTYAEVYVEQRQAETTDALTAQSAELRSQAQTLVRRQAEIDEQLARPGLDPVVADGLRQERFSLATQIASFGQRADQLDVDAELRQQASRIVSRAPLNLTPIAPKPIQSAVIALVIGLILAVCVAVLLEILQDRLSSVNSLDLLDADVGVLTSVPHVDDDLDEPGHTLPPAALEAFRYLRTAIRFQGLDRPMRSLVISSATIGEGKTTTAVNLAIVCAEAGSRVVLVDADMRRPSIHERLGIDNDVGLSDVLAGERSFSDALVFSRPTLAVLTAGRPSVSANELLGDDRLAQMIEAMAGQCDLVIIDAPPVLPVADALLASRAADAAILVARLGEVRRSELKAALRRFRDANLRVLGLVANDISSDETSGVYEQYIDAPQTVDA